MATAVYECMFLLDSNAYARDPGGLAQKLQDVIENVGGKVLASRLWNEQRLAYPVNGQRKGTYWLTYFEIDGQRMTKFNRAVQLTDSVLRHLALKIDPRLVDLMVSAARGEREMPTRSSMEKAENTDTAADNVEEKDRETVKS